MCGGCSSGRNCQAHERVRWRELSNIHKLTHPRIITRWDQCAMGWRRSQPARSAIEVSVFQYTYTWTTEVLWGKRDCVATLSRGEVLWAPLPLPQGGSATTLALTGFYWFSRPLTSKKVLFNKGLFGVVFFADTGEGVAEYIKGGYLQCKGEMV